PHAPSRPQGHVPLRGSEGAGGPGPDSRRQRDEILPNGEVDRDRAGPYPAWNSPSNPVVVPPVIRAILPERRKRNVSEFPFVVGSGAGRLHWSPAALRRYRRGADRHHRGSGD